LGDFSLLTLFKKEGADVAVKGLAATAASITTDQDFFYAFQND
jgi:hypothetical protein